MNSMSGAKTKPTNSNPSKLTQAQIAAARERLDAQLSALAPKKKNVQEPAPLMENPNRNTEDVLEARNVEDAIQALK